MKKISRLASGCIIVAAMFGFCAPFVSCVGHKCEKTSDNPHVYVLDADKVAMITSLKVLEPECLYEMDYTADYRLDELIEAGVCDVESFIRFFAVNMLDSIPTVSPIAAFSSGCSAYAATEAVNGDFLMGRNYDFCHRENGGEVPISAIFVRTAPGGGKKSVSMVDSYWLGFHKGFYNDGVSDLSMLMAAPYQILDGINEDGFAMGILHLDGTPTRQDEPGKRPLWTNIMMRKLIDEASTVEEALAMASQYNVTMVSPATGNFHFFLADATGDFAILEYSYSDTLSIGTAAPNVMKVFRGSDCDRYVTNFYVDPTLAEHSKLGPRGKHGLWRYDTLRVTLERNGYKLTEIQAMDLLKAVSQDPNPDIPTSHTQWSSLYNLTEKTVDICILQDYRTKYSFSVE